MVKVLACHHFQGQEIGQCEEAVGLTLAENVIIIALENKVNIYSSLQTQDLQEWFSKRRQSYEFGYGEFGKFFQFQTNFDSNKTDFQKNINTDNDEIGNELVLFHSFAPVDVIKTISYNSRGHYLLSLEKHDIGIGATNTDAHSVRAYFQWDRKTEGKQMRARIAGLVSPTGGEGDNNLKMIEIPPTPFFATQAVSSCCLTGNIACLSSDSRVNIYTFKVKECSGRNKTQYADFDLICTIQISGSSFSPTRISFNLDFISCSDPSQVLVLRIVSNEPAYIDANRKPGFDLFSRANKISNEMNSPYLHNVQTNGFHHHQNVLSDAVVFDPKINSVKVYLPTITKINRKAKQPNLFLTEEFQDNIILNKSNVTYSHPFTENGYVVQHLLRISSDSGVGAVADTKGNDFVQVEFYPIRIMGKIGGVSCIVGTSKEVFVYNLSMKRNVLVTRISTHPLTSNLISFSFDSFFLHTITESGLETYTLRNLYHPLKEAEGFQLFENDCPLQNESPILVGIRPFLGVRFMSANKYTTCLLSSPAAPLDLSSTASIMTMISNEENLWTIYSLRSPNMDLIYYDILRAAQLHQESSPDSYFILLCELHQLLRATLNSYPESETLYRNKYLETCRLIALEYFRKSTKEYSTPLCLDSNELVDKGVTYLRLAGCDLQFIFAPENVSLTKDPALIHGIVRFIQVSLPIVSVEFESDSRLSPTLSKLIVEFLANHSSEILVALVLDVAWLRECNSSRLVEILTPLAETHKYRREEALALMLCLVARHGEDSTGRRRVKQVLSKCQTHDLESNFQLSWLLNKRNKQYSISDLTICLSAAKAPVHINVLTSALHCGKILLNDIVVAFAQGVNLNSDPEIQQSLSKSLSSILENYFVEKLKSIRHEEPKNVVNPALLCSTDEIRALHALVRSYLTNISTNSKNTPISKLDSNKLEVGTTIENGDTHKLVDIHSNDLLQSEETKAKSPGLVRDLEIEQKSQMFGKTPNFISLIISDLFYEGKSLPGKPSPFSTTESKENFVKLTSLLGSPLGHIDGVHELVLTTLRKGHVDVQLQTSLEMLCETCEKAIDISMSKYPNVLIVYAKEIFGKSTRSWKILVSKLKGKIMEKSDGVEAFTTIIESVYLHVANILSPTELEEVLDKGEENAKFYSACRRVELANTFSQKVVQLSTLYLDQTK